MNYLYSFKIYTHLKNYLKDVTNRCHFMHFLKINSQK